MKKHKIVLLYNAPVILTYAIVAFAVLGLSWITHGKSNTYFMVFRSSWLDPLQYLRLFTHVLGHGGFSHYYGNFLMILLLGPIVEEKYGSSQLLWMIALTALITGLIQVIFFPGVGLLGASGIVYMLIVLSSATNFRRGEIPITMIVIAVLYLGGQLLQLVTPDSISQMAHIVGGICGGVFGVIFCNRK